MAKYLVTGGLTFLGRRVAEHLMERGDDVRILDMAEGEAPEGAELLRGDFRDPSVTDRACAGMDGLAHVASAMPTMPGNVIRDMNISGTANLLESAARAEIPQIVFNSSHAVYGRPPAILPCPEEAPLNADGPYSLSKLIGEEMVMRMRDRHGVRATIIRPAHVLGPGYSVEHNLRMIYDRAIQNRPLMMLGNGGVRRHYADVDDVAAAFVAAFDTRAADGETFNVGFARPHSDREYTGIVMHATRSLSPVIPVPRFLADIAMRILELLDRSPMVPEVRRATFSDAYYDVSKAVEILGWSPQKKLIDSVRDTMKWYKRKQISGN